MVTLNSIEAYEAAWLHAKNDPEGFWAEVANSFTWRKPWHKVLEWNFAEPSIKWFDGAELNITENCLDRHLPHRANQTALIWEPNDPADAAKSYTYGELIAEVCRTANALVELGIKPGDRVCIYMPMIPELMIAVLATARVGAIHNVVFGGFSAHSLADRINDSDCVLVITADEGKRGAKPLPIKALVDEAIISCPSVKHVLVYDYQGMSNINMVSGRDVRWQDIVSLQKPTFEAVARRAEDPLFILYTSGSTGKPKGVVHTNAGYMVYAEYSFRNVFQYKEEQVFWCTADLGWITGHTYLTYAPLLAGGTTLMFEGIPTWPDTSRFWQVVERHKVDILYTAPTAIRALMLAGLEQFEGRDLSSLKVLGSVGEPINEEAYWWYHKYVGGGRCPVTDTWWQTETGGILIATLAGVTPERPAWATLPLPGVRPLFVDTNGQIIEEVEAEGNLCLEYPMPGMVRTTWGDHERCRQSYFATYPNLYFTGDGAMRDKYGMYRILGRVDDVINVSGHRLGTAEIENAINLHPAVVESAVVGYPHDIKGQGIYGYVILRPEMDKPGLVAEIQATVAKEIGALARPDLIQVVLGLPKTRSGKIMRRILRKVAEGDATSLGDTSTLLDPTVVQNIIEGALVPVKV